MGSLLCCAGMQLLLYQQTAFISTRELSHFSLPIPVGVGEQLGGAELLARLNHNSLLGRTGLKYQAKF